MKNSMATPFSQDCPLFELFQDINGLSSKETQLERREINPYQIAEGHLDLPNELKVVSRPLLQREEN
jgi:hypothetical protein